MVSGTILFDPMPAALTSPTAGSTLTGSSETFRWTAGVNVQRFHIYVGTAEGASDIFSGNQGKNKFATISGLPTDGSQLHVRIWSALTSGWAFEDTIFLAATTQAGNLTVSVDPPTGKPGDSFHITVSGGTPGDAVTIDYYDDDASTLPSNYNADGEAWFVRQTSIRDTADIEFWIQTVGRDGEMVSGTIVFDPMPGRLTSPTAGSTLGGSSETFTWTAGVKVQEFYLYVGTTEGASDIYFGSQGKSQIATLSGLPTDGSRLYVRLWSALSGTWVFEDTIVSAASLAKTVPAEMRSPTDGTLLFASGATFNWGGGVGVAMYWLYIGSSPGQYDIYNAGQGLTTEETVTNLPTDGRSLYVRLWSLLNSGMWDYHDVQYRTATFIDSGDSLGLGDELPSYVRITGDIARAREEDSFSFFAHEGVDYTFSTELFTLPDSVLELRSPKGTVVAFNDDF